MIFLQLHRKKEKESVTNAEEAQDKIYQRYLGERNRVISRFYARHQYLSGLHCKGQEMGSLQGQKAGGGRQGAITHFPAEVVRQSEAPAFKTPTNEKIKMTLKVRANWSHRISTFK